MRPDATAIATARPARIAYVIEDGPDGHQWLTEIISSCFSNSSLCLSKTDMVMPVSGLAGWLSGANLDAAGQTSRRMREQIDDHLGHVIGLQCPFRFGVRQSAEAGVD